MKLGKCKKGFDMPGCHEGYHTWFAAGCLCDYSAYPWGFLPKDITPVGFTWALMKTNLSYAQVSSESGCLEQMDDCNAPREGDVRLDAYGHGALLLHTGRHWRRVVGEVDNATAHAQCLRLGFSLGGLAETAGMVPFDSQTMAYVHAPCADGGGSLVKCMNHARHPAGLRDGRARVVRLACTQDGPAGCFVARNGHRQCVVGKKTYNHTTGLPAHTPSFACGTSGSRFLTLPPMIEQPKEEDTGVDAAACRSLFGNVLARCSTADQSNSRWPNRQMCSDGCHDTILQAILAEQCHETVVNSTWGDTFGAAIKGHAEILYSQCGRDLWQTAAVSVSLYEGCMDMLLDMWRKCQEESQKHLCSDSCAQRVNEAMRSESCYDMHYFRRDSKTFRGHVEIMRELRIRVCQRQQPTGLGYGE